MPKRPGRKELLGRSPFEARRCLRTCGAASIEICALLRKPDAARVEVDVKYLGFDIPNQFVVGYGLDYAERYRNLRDVAILAPHVYS